jgi:DNA-binding transcriptional MocR family regulator
VGHLKRARAVCPVIPEPRWTHPPDFGEWQTVADAWYVISPAQMARLLGGWQCDTAAYVALADRIRVLIREGCLTPDTRIPPERTLAQHLGVSRTTVTKAYDLLRRESAVRSARGSGTVICLPQPGAGEPARAPASGAPLEILRPTSGWVANFTSDALPVPEARVAQALRSTAGEVARVLADRARDPRGLPELRQAIADRYTARGMPTSPTQILLTQSALHSWHLLLRLRAKPAQPVIVECPSAPQVIDAIRLHGARPWPLVLAGNGWDIDMFGAVLRQVRPQLAYLTPDFQHPTGHVMSSGERRFLVRNARQSGTLLVADESAAELRLDGGQMPASLATHDCDDQVVLLGSARAMLGDGVKVGWIRAAPAITARLAHHNAAFSTEGAAADQVITARLLESASELLTERRSSLLRQRDALADAVHRHLPGWRFTLPHGGTALWVDLGRPASTALAMAAERHRVRLLSGPRLGTGGIFDNYLRLPFTLSEHALREGVRLLARADEDAVAPSCSAPLRVAGQPQHLGAGQALGFGSLPGQLHLS